MLKGVPVGATLAGLLRLKCVAVAGAAFTALVCVAALLAPVGSAVLLVTVAVSDNTVPLATLALTPITTVNVAEAPAARVAMLPETMPFVPVAGFVKVNAGPLGCVSETNVVPAGSVSRSETLWASFGPLLVTVRVKVRLLPACAGLGEPVSVTARSALGGAGGGG